MTAMGFPVGPTVGLSHTVGLNTYTWTGSYWDLPAVNMRVMTDHTHTYDGYAVVPDYTNTLFDALYPGSVPNVSLDGGLVTDTFTQTYDPGAF